jgi:hypothetical protein
MLAGPTTTRRHNTTPMRESAWLLFGQLPTFDVTYIVMSSIGDGSSTVEVVDGVEQAHREARAVGLDVYGV